MSDHWAEAKKAAGKHIVGDGVYLDRLLRAALPHLVEVVLATNTYSETGTAMEHEERSVHELRAAAQRLAKGDT